MNITGIVFHWSEGTYDQIFNNYHYNITYARDRACVVKTCCSDFEPKDHIWHRNNGRIGISLCCASGATPENPGDFPPVEAQIETACALAGKLAHIYSIKKDEINTHAVWAFIDGYGIHSRDKESRWDLWVPSWENGKNLTQVMKDKTLWYKEQFHMHVDNSDNMYEERVIDLANGDRLYMPSIFKLAREAHIVTESHKKFRNSWPESFKDDIEEHYKLSESSTEYSMIRNEPWCFSDKPDRHFGQGKEGQKPSEMEEGWYISLNWKEVPPRGTRFIIKNPVNGRTVVAIAGYETGTGRTGNLAGGICEEIHHYLGTGHGSKLEVGVAKDQTLCPGPKDDNCLITEQFTGGKDTIYG
jgi:hypothetical protein